MAEVSESVARSEDARHLEPWFVVATSLVAVTAAIVSVVATRRSPLFFPDSAIYVGTADNLVSGHGITTPFNLIFNPYPPFEAAGLDGEVPLTIFPPLFPVLIAAVHQFGLSLIDSARLIEAVAYAGSVFLVGGITRRVSGNAGVGFVGALGFAVSAPVLFTHASLMSDPVLLVLLLLGFVLVDRFLAEPTSSHLAALAVCCAAASLTRYAGLSLTATAVVLVLAGRATPRRSRVRSTAVLLASGVLPLAFWVLVAAGSSESTAARRPGFHPPGTVDGETVRDVVSSWLVGLHADLATRWIAIAVAVVLGAAAVVLYRRLPAAQRDGSRIVAVLLVFVLAFVATVVAARTFTDALFPMDSRNLLPLYTTLFLLATGLAGRVATVRVGRGLAIALVSGVVLLATWPGRDALYPGLFRSAADVATDGVADFRRSPLSAAAARLPDGALLVTNGADRLYMEQGRPAITVPARHYVVEGRDNPAYLDEVRELGVLLEERCAYLVMYDTGPGGALPSTDELARELRLATLERRADGGIYTVQDAVERCGFTVSPSR